MLQSKYLNRIQILATGLLMVMLGCNRNNPSRHSQDSTKQPLQAGIQAAPFPKPSSNSETLFMALSPADTGIDFTNQIVADHKMKYLYASSMACGGVAIGDFDNDGMPDIYLTNGPKQNRLFRQTSPLKFEDVTEKAKVDGAG